MKQTLQQIKNKIAIERYALESWDQLVRVDPESAVEAINEVAKLYANSKLNEAACHVGRFCKDPENNWIDSESILSLKDPI